MDTTTDYTPDHEDNTEATEGVTTVADPKIDLTELSETLNGYDQVAIRARFHERFDQLAEDPIMFARAMYFVHLRRESHAAGNGFRDKEAFDAAMGLPMKDINELFEAGDADDFDGDESATAERDTGYANFVIGTGLSFTVDQYQALTIQQRSKMIEAANNR